MKILIAGEGPTELGGFYAESMWREEPIEKGVIEALLVRVREDGWRIVDGVTWKRIRKYRTGQHRSAETRTILGLVLDAKDRGATVLAFTRDRDGDPEREADIEEGIARAKELFPGVEIIGGAAREDIEAWILALLGVRRSESVGDTKGKLREEHGIGGVRDKVAAIERANFARVPDDAVLLRTWLERAAAVLLPPARSAAD